MTDWSKAALAIMANERKLQLAAVLNHALQGDTQVVAARRLNTTQSRISQLRGFDCTSISLDRLIRWVLRLGYDVEIRVQRPRRRRR